MDDFVQTFVQTRIRFSERWTGTETSNLCKKPRVQGGVWSQDPKTQETTADVPTGLAMGFGGHVVLARTDVDPGAGQKKRKKKTPPPRTQI